MKAPRIVTDFMDSPLITSNHRLAITTADDSYLVYDLDSCKLHRLNATAALILELCNGQRSIADISNILDPLLQNNPISCIDWIKFATDEGLLVTHKSSASEVKRPTPQDFRASSIELRADGEILAAFVCQEQATEMESDNAVNWLGLGELAHILGRRDRAREAYQQYLVIQPDNAETRHILDALLDKDPPSRAPDECIVQLYSRFAEFYEHNMCDELDYAAPELVREAIATVLPSPQFISILELGCGTGLAGKYLKPLANTLVGIDLSPDMAAICSATGLYDQIHVAEITAFLANADSVHQLIVACDTFIYFGDLRQVIFPAVRCLNSGGLFIFTVEKTDFAPFKLTDSGRYAHSKEHIVSTAREAGLEVFGITESILRKEYGNPVLGFVAVLRKN